MTFIKLKSIGNLTFTVVGESLTPALSEQHLARLFRRLATGCQIAPKLVTDGASLDHGGPFPDARQPGFQVGKIVDVLA